MPGKDDNLRKRSFMLIILFGVISLFSDTIYEGARSVNGPYLALLGANAAIVGFVAGAGELMGYGIRVFTGYLSDKTRWYWLFTFIGYSMLLSVPAMALTGIWQFAAFFIVMERLGKAFRSPSKDTILSMVSSRVGRGLGFGLHEAMDQIGAFIGPMIFSALFAYYSAGGTASASDYRRGYMLLLIPFVLMLLSLVTARIAVPEPEKYELSSGDSAPVSEKFPPVFWAYTAFSFFATAGFAVFTLIAYHIKFHSLMNDAYIPAIYAGAMLVDGIAAVIIGKIYDSKGLGLLIFMPLLTLPVVFLSFSMSVKLIIAGAVLWGMVMGMHETIMKAAIADLTHVSKRGMGYGIFNAVYGAALFAGGTAMGVLYTKGGYVGIGCFSIIMELAAVAIYFKVLSKHTVIAM